MKGYGISRTSSVKTNAILNVLLTVTNILFPLITFPYVSRVLQADILGRVNWYSNISSYLVTLASLGISTYGIRATAKVRDEREKLSQVSQELFILNLVGSVAVTVILILVSNFSLKLRQDTSLLYICCLIIVFTPFSMNWLFSGLEQYSYITKRSLFLKTSALILTLLLVRRQEDYVWYAGLLASVPILTGLINFAYARSFISFHLRKLNFKSHIRPMILLFASILAINVYTHLDAVMLGVISGDTEVGYYTVAVYVKTALLAFVNAISVVLMPRITYLVESGNKGLVDKLLRKSIIVIMHVAIPLTLFFVFEASDTVLVLGGDGYLPAITCMRVTMPVLIVSGVSNITGNQILIPRGKDEAYTKAVMIGAVVDILLNSILMSKYGCVGAAIATLVAEVTQLTVQLYFAGTFILESISWKSIAKIVFSGAISSSIAYICANTLADQPLFRLIVSAIALFNIYVLLIYIMKEQVFIDTVHDAIQKLKRT